MSREFSKAFYDSKAWRSCRKSFIDHRVMIDGGLCQICHERLGYIVHHKTELTPQNISDPDIALNWRNLQYVCFECHNKFDGIFVRKSRVIFDEDGNVLERPSR